MKREFMNTTIIKDGKIVRALVPMDEVKTGWSKGEWNKEIEDYKKERVQSLTKTIAKVQKILDTNQDLSEYERIMLLFYIDQMRVDLREDKQRIKYKGQIPKHIDERCVRQATKSFNKYRQWGDEMYEQLRQDIDVHFWGNVIIEQDPTSGGGKI